MAVKLPQLLTVDMVLAGSSFCMQSNKVVSYDWSSGGHSVQAHWDFRPMGGSDVHWKQVDWLWATSCREYKARISAVWRSVEQS